MRGQLIRVAVNGDILKTPLKATPGLDMLSDIVDGYIEVVPYFDVYIDAEGVEHRCVVFCNEEGKVEGRQRNELATLLWMLACKRHNISTPGNDYLVGDIAIVIGDAELLRDL